MFLTIYNRLVKEENTKGVFILRKLFTSESVTEGHPDKVCDQISDAVLDAILALDPMARVACECSATTDFLLIMGEITTSAKVDIEQIARNKIAEIGYNNPNVGFSSETCKILVKLNTQSPDIAMGVNSAVEGKVSLDKYDMVGAGDQGMMFGYACDQTEEFMPLPIVLSHHLTLKLSEVRKKGILPYLRPDGKSQVTVEYVDGIPTKIDTIVLSTQHSDQVDIETLRADIKKHVIDSAIDPKLMDENTKIFINPTGRFEIGGPQGDSGLTGRKIIVDTYGGYAPHGGGAFSGKDSTKVDRSACYMARYVAKNLVASGLCKECTIEVAYAIGVARPVSIFVDSHGTGVLSDEKLCEIVSKEFDFRPLAIIEKFGLRNPIFSKTSSYGHFGRNIFPWEQLDKAESLKKYL